MKNKLMLFGCVFVLLLSSTVFAADGVYVGGNIGLSILHDSDLTEPGTILETEFDPGFDVNGIIGFYAADQVRVEAELAYRSNDVDSLHSAGTDIAGVGEASALSLLANVFYDIKTGSAVTPYLGGGIGFATIEFKDITGGGIMTGSADDTVFAYQLGFGIGYEINENTTLDIGYRYFATTNPNLNETDAEYASSNFMIGIRVAL